MRSKFDRQLVQLNDMLQDMGAHIERAIAMVKQALLDSDVGIANKIIELEDDIDQKEKEIEALCLKLLLQQQPVAKDLRLVSAALKMITDMERIGDQATDISEIVVEGAIIPDSIKKEQFAQMADATIEMVSKSIAAFVEQDLQIAKYVIKRDDKVDDLFDDIKKSLIDLIHADSENGEQAISLLMIAKYFERIGDHAVNIAKWARFSITGRKKTGESKNSAS
ncbi:MAG: phosphate signaling complex protein PhoU [Defluviitaleaceae bacterium]|nr:phosphate signaling complex protein PhoU [Defluviitaleaceae bacterium]